MDIGTNRFLSIEQLKDQYLNTNNKTNSAQTTDEGMSFGDILAQKSGTATEVKFSKHATSRLNTRNIELTDDQLSRLNEGTYKASMKGIKDSLVMVDQLSFIVNVPSNTVVTAMDNTEAKDNIFTNIDGAVIA